MKKNIVLVSLFLGLGIALIFAGYLVDRLSKPDANPIVSDADPHMEVSMNENEDILVGPTVQEWMQGQSTAEELYLTYRSYGQVYSAAAVDLRWGIFDIPDGSFITKQYFELSVDPDYDNVSRYELTSGARGIELQHLLVDTTYFYRITMELESSEACVAEGNFHTKWSPRIIDLANLSNVRDIGGWKTADGKTVRQEMLYRGCELDGATAGRAQITEEAADIMVKQLGIITEIDLRSSDTPGAGDMLGAAVSHQYFAVPSYSGCFTSAGYPKIRLVFATLAEEENYPLYLHCDNGNDRTGVICFLLEALLGVPEEDCYRDWELSILSNGKAAYEEMDDFLERLRSYPGSDLQEKTENYLLTIGVTAGELESIRNILLP